MEDVGGRRLDWFWREWFLENPHFDSGDRHGRHRAGGDTTSSRCGSRNRARGVLPIHARFTFTDGSKQNYDYPAEVWSTNTTFYVRDTVRGKKLAKIELDPDKRLVDIDRDNNVWPTRGVRRNRDRVAGRGERRA